MSDVYVFNQTGSEAFLIINKGKQLSIAGTSDTAKWVAQSSTLELMEAGTAPGKLSAGITNILRINFGNQQAFQYEIIIPEGCTDSIQIHIFSGSTDAKVPTLVVLKNGQPLTKDLDFNKQTGTVALV